MSEKERVDIYTIPPNFAEEGTVMSGRVRTRNACETAVLVFFLLRLLLSLDISDRGRIYAGVIVIIPAAIFGILGIQGESLTVFAYHFFCYLKNRRVLARPDGKYRLQRNRRIRKREKMQEKIKARKGGKGHRQRYKRIKGKIKPGKTSGEGTAEGREGPAETGEEAAERGAEG